MIHSGNKVEIILVFQRKRSQQPFKLRGLDKSFKVPTMSLKSTCTLQNNVIALIEKGFHFFVNFMIRYGWYATCIFRYLLIICFVITKKL